MRRQITRASQVAIDITALTISLSAAFFIRFDWNVPTDYLGRLFLVGPYIIVFQYLVLRIFGIHRFSWRYVGLREVLRIGVAAGFAALALLAARVIIGVLASEHIFLRHGLVPVGVIAANALLVFVTITGTRVARRLVGERADAKHQLSEVTTRGSQDAVPTMLVGAGQAGVLVAKELAQRREIGMVPVGFLDDDTLKHGTVIHGIPVVGPTASLRELCEKHGARQLLITMANVPGHAVRRIRDLAERASIPAKIIPGLYEIVGGQVNLTRIRDVAIEDLLGREPVALDAAALGAYLGGRSVLVTGAGGSIGSEICRQIAHFSPKKLVLLDSSENALFEVHRELLQAFGTVELVPCVADIKDRRRLAAVFEEHCPHAVFHAAAHKHVPMMEANPGEAVKNNIGGTIAVADVALASGCDAFVMISTDKAVNPSSIMGATKRVAELYIQRLAARASTRFVTVRFGNVLGSNGSVIPIFRAQIERGGPVTVTHPEMQRYFMTIPEACQLVLQAGSMGKGGEIFILDMGAPVKIVDLAKDLLALSGLREGDDIEIVYTGIRPGEKLFEELSTADEHAQRTTHPKIFIRKGLPPVLPTFPADLQAVLDAATGSRDDVVRALKALVPEFTQGPPPDKVDREDVARFATTRAPRVLARGNV